MQTLQAYAVAQGAVSAKKVKGPNGAFIVLTLANGQEETLPVGKKSQTGSLAEFNVLIAEDGQPIATVNLYETEEELSFAVPNKAQTVGSRGKAIN